MIVTYKTLTKYRVVRSLAIIILSLVFLTNGLRAQENYPTGSMEYPVRAITQRSSSYDRNWENGNNDARQFEPGQTRILADLNGPGRITHIWFTAFGYERGFPRSTIIRIYWDGNEEAAVEAPLGDFFASGHGMQVNVNSSMVATSSFGRAYNCYWNMPFKESASITITNESLQEAIGLYWYVDWEKRPVPDDIPYFHAQYRQENPVQTGKDYLIADIEGKGHYVGTVLSVRASQSGWFGEGDDRFYIDGDTIPTLHGTGSEDYFNDAWAFRTVNRPFYGVSIWEGMNTGSRITAYKWHVTDPVFFDERLKFTIEHKGNTFLEDNTLVEAYSDRRPDFYSSVAFWYQQGEAKRFSEIPSVDELMTAYEMIQVDETLADNLAENVTIDENRSYSNSKGLRFKPKEVGDYIEIPFEIAEKGNYLIFARVWPRGESGIYDFYLNDQLLVKAKDLFAEHHFVTDIKLGNMQSLEKGTNIMRLVFQGKSNSLLPGDLFLDAIVIEPVGIFEKKIQSE